MKDQDATPPDISGKLLQFLDAAYEAPFDPGNFDEVIDSAAAYLFASASDPLPAWHVRQGLHDPLIESHSARLQRMLEAQETDVRTRPEALVKNRLAALVIDPSGTCIGNSNAASLFGLTFPCELEDLRFSGDTAALLRRMLADTRRNVPMETDAAVLEMPDGERFVARITQHQHVDPDSGESCSGLAVTIARVAWGDDSLPLIQGAFGLSTSESEVLLEILRGRSHAEIAELRGRSVETIRSQAKAILGKTGFARMPQLIAILNQMALFSEPGIVPEAEAHVPAMPDALRLDVGEGRRLAYRQFGRVGGMPVLFVHGYITGPYFNAPLVDGFSSMGLDVLAPSRPGFGQSSVPRDWDAYDDVVVADALALAEARFGEPVLIVAHQGGVSHACRIARALGPRCRGMLMVSAGIPIDDARHVRHMNRQTRVAAIAARYTPSMFAMLLRIGIAQFNRIGHVAYLNKYFQGSHADIEALKRPDILDLYRRSVHHMITQGTRHMVTDGRAAMADWGGDYKALGVPIRWLHGSADPVMEVSFVEEWAKAHGHDPVDIVEGGANSMLWLHADRVLQALAGLIEDTENDG
ncbi:alpha/beta hydrolase [Sagittula stellata]|uniref:Transcriptional regulator, LuxR family/hydrolase, alpha/beta fold family protein n=1 Tax=Sagittula stellata (strain ATCC 700073 / DSM 11524 / E-37) TaxID=388399 RepID=A3K0S3_SAGS3|nr:alpha/beta hydrolase [Sagittula stellata]EBA09388.1 transcriptional regulator, LuxR family/hydrolase, alpha/beta fold family protein [Sagittula stellata E-37]